MVEVRHEVDLDDVKRILQSPRDVEQAAFTSFSPEAFLTMLANRKTFGGTLYEDGEPFMAAGATRLSPTDAFVWLVASKDLKPYRETVFDEVSRGIAGALKSGLKLHATITPGQDVALRFIHKLGFQPHPDNPTVFIKAPQ